MKLLQGAFYICIIERCILVDFGAWDEGWRMESLCDNLVLSATNFTLTKG